MGRSLHFTTRREALFFRLNVISLALPALKDRREDLPALIDHLLRTRQVGKTPFTVNPVAMAVLCGYDWLGNIRELANVTERAQILAEGDTITVDVLPENLVQVSKPVAVGSASAPVPAVDPDDLDGVERRHVEGVLRRHDGNKVRAAKALGVSRRTLYRLIEKSRPAGTESEAERAPRPG